MARPARYSSVSALSGAAMLLLTLRFPLPPAASAMESVDFSQAVARALSNNAFVLAAEEEATPRATTRTRPAGTFSLPSGSMKNSSARPFPRRRSGSR